MIPLVDLLASVRGNTRGWTGPSLTSTLTVLSLLRTSRSGSGGRGASWNVDAGGGGRAWGGSGGREQVSGDTEPVEDVTLLGWDVVGNTLRSDGLEERAVNLPCPAIHGRVVLGLDRRAGVLSRYESAESVKL